MSFDICIKTIPHTEQRYPTTGDYWIDADGIMQVRISELGNPAFEWAVLVHELTEIALVLHRGIKIEDIDAFDIQFEANRTNNIDEPGDDPSAPYQNEHCLATAAERMLIAAMGVKWADYDKVCRDA